tara:strand:+ start:3591 stop:4517 length:927 start_codon:yes stop_codon:yes gene_type:complete
MNIYIDGIDYEELDSNIILLINWNDRMKNIKLFHTPNTNKQVYFKNNNCYSGTYKISLVCGDPQKHKPILTKIKIEIYNNIVYEGECFYNEHYINIQRDSDKIFSKKIDKTIFNKEKNKIRIQFNKSIFLYWNIWWYNIHNLAINYPDEPNNEDKLQIINFMEELCKVTGMSCPRCRKHLSKYLKNNPLNISLIDKKTFFKYTVELHNDVNKDSKQKIFSYENALEKYSKLHDSGVQWTEYLSQFGTNSLELFRKRKLVDFIKIYNTKGRYDILKHIELFQDDVRLRDSDEIHPGMVYGKIYDIEMEK